MSYSTLVVEAIRQHTADTKSIEFTPSESWSYKPGQFLTIVRKHRDQEIRRQYSFSSHPILDRRPTITFKRIPNGEVSRWLFDDVKVGDAIQTIGASGYFTLPDDTSSFEKILLLSAGSGITPNLSIIKEVLHFHPHLSCVLIYSNHSEESTLFLKELRTLQQAFASRLSVEFLFSNARDLKRARLGKYVLEELFRLHVPHPQKTLAFVCGPLDYRQMANITLLNEGIPADQIRKEIFHTPLAAARPEPRDKDRHRVEVLFEGSKHQFDVQYPDTILQAAKNKQILLPFSCEAGRCGTCAATCLEGEVWMSRNEVLLDSEMSKGRILTCTGYPIGGDVRLKIE